MIVRILGEGQYRLDDAAFATVSAIDDRVQEAADAGDAERFDRELRELVAEITRLGTRSSRARTRSCPAPAPRWRRRVRSSPRRG